MRISSAARPGEGPAAAERNAQSATAPGRRGTESERRTLAEIILICLSTPALMAALALGDLESDSILCLAGLWTLVQMPLLVLLFQQRVKQRGEPPLQEGDDAALDQRAERAEATLRREEERLHELRATVSGIGLTRRLLRERTAELPPPARTRLEDLYESELSRLERLVEDQAPVPAPSAAVNVTSLVDPLIESFRLRGIDVVSRSEHALAHGRPDEVVEIVQNLLENAARHAGGSEVVVSVSARDDEVRIDVSDGGPGVPAALQPMLFERGVRGAGSPGRGLGLHIARRLARGMGGDLSLDSEGGEGGAGFTLTLPAARDGAPCLARAE